MAISALFLIVVVALVAALVIGVVAVLVAIRLSRGTTADTYQTDYAYDHTTAGLGDSTDASSMPMMAAAGVAAATVAHAHEANGSGGPSDHAEAVLGELGPSDFVSPDPEPIEDATRMPDPDQAFTDSHHGFDDGNFDAGGAHDGGFDAGGFDGGFDGGID